MTAAADATSLENAQDARLPERRVARPWSRPTLDGLYGGKVPLSLKSAQTANHARAMLRVVILLACAVVAARAQVQQAIPPLVNCLSRDFTPKSGICKGIDMSSESCWPSAKCDVDAKGNQNCDSKEVKAPLCCQCED